jgi:putative PIN family toxin of toxin-antitoxin system
MQRVVVDTNVFVSAILNRPGAPRGVIRLALEKKVEPLMGTTLFCEYEDVLGRSELFKDAGLPSRERGALFDAFLTVCVWTPVYYLWRPNLPDEGDNHLLELALGGGADTIVTGNRRDFSRGELSFPGLKIASPAEFMKDWNAT